jgi:hypothetical protein
MVAINGTDSRPTKRVTMNHFLLLKLILTLNNDAVDNTIAGQERFIMALSDTEVTELSEQVEDIGIVLRRLLERREWRGDNRQEELSINNG